MGTLLVLPESGKATCAGEVEVCGLRGLSPHQTKKSQENQGWMVSLFSPAKKRVGCCGQDPPPPHRSGRRQGRGSGESWGLSARAGAQGKGNEMGAEVQRTAERFAHLPCAAMETCDTVGES